MVCASNFPFQEWPELMPCVFRLICDASKAPKSGTDVLGVRGRWEKHFFIAKRLVVGKMYSCSYSKGTKTILAHQKETVFLAKFQTKINHQTV